MSWDVAVPADSDFISLGAGVIRTFKTDLQTALRGNAADGTEAKFPGSDTANPVFRYRGLKGTTAARPTAGQYGLYINTTLNTIQRDNGSSWEDVATLIPSGTKMVFYQASAPTGWTAVSVNDKFLRVVTAGGTGGSTGGTVAASTSLAHSHTVNSHTHTMGNHTHTISHRHTLPISSPGPSASNDITVADDEWGQGTETIDAGSGSGFNNDSGPSGSIAWMKSRDTDTASSGGPSTNTSDAASPGTDSQFAGAFAYADIIICSKD